MDTIIFYHNDLDGLTSALGYAYVEYLNTYYNTPKYEDLRNHFYFFEVHYGMDDIFSILKRANININSFKKAVIVDYSFNRQTMSNLLDIFKNNLIWIDHHKNIILEMSDLEINGLRDDSNSASVLVWKYFKKTPSLFSQYVEDMDLWNWNLPDSKDILQYIDFLYLQIYDKETNKEFEINNEFLKLFNDDYFKDCFSTFKQYGKLMTSYVTTKVKDMISAGKVIMFEGIKTFVVNSQFKAGHISEYIFYSKHYKDVEMIFVWYRCYGKNDNSSFDKVSVRSRTIDSSIISKKYGGNGHPKASGFIIDDFSKL